MDLTGQRFGNLTVQGDSGQRKGNSILWRCVCTCGGEILAVRRQLVSGTVENCGCAPKRSASKGTAEDLTGRQFGELTALRRVENDKNNRVCWLCKCSCGNEAVVQASRLKSGHTRSCGCKRYGTPHNKYDLTGHRFGRLTALYSIDRKDRVKNSYWHCKCDCGNELDVCSGNLLRGATQSCGCWNREQSARMHEHMHYQDGTCMERLERVRTDVRENKAGFRGLFRTKSGKYRVTITFQKKRYNLGYFLTYEAAVQSRLEAEEILHIGYLTAFAQYEKKAQADPAWAQENPFYFCAAMVNGTFRVHTNGGELPPEGKERSHPAGETGKVLKNRDVF